MLIVAACMENYQKIMVNPKRWSQQIFSTFA